ncbi:hypothetical protein ILYODFUR_002539 [Ilyodon furcidens]|uniref:Uncharacterized protein n=1 Tax=Ilyodon furcidens TaxID=33524 RepID=A0ABV0SW99_9TELE
MLKIKKTTTHVANSRMSSLKLVEITFKMMQYCVARWHNRKMVTFEECFMFNGLKDRPVYTLSSVGGMLIYTGNKSFVTEGRHNEPFCVHTLTGLQGFLFTPSPVSDILSE